VPGVRRIGDAERRRRVARRHALAPAYRLGDPVAVTRAMTVLHATEPATVHLAVAARTEGVTVADVDSALYDDRTLVKQLAMRRTLFVFPRDLLPAAWGSASARVASAELKRIAGDVERAGVAPDGLAWLEEVARAVLDHLGDGRARDAGTLRAELPVLDTRVGAGTGAYSQLSPVGPRVLTLLGARGDVVRGRNGGRWRVSRPAWTATADWLGAPAAPAGEREGYAELVRRWLATFGPGTETDVVWWLGATKTAARRALADVGAVEVALDDGATGWVLPGDDRGTAEVEPWAALLPTLDPTVMGWKQRSFYLDPDDVPFLFDTNGNAGTTAWWDGRVVGCWVQDPDSSVRVVLRRDPGAEARRALDVEAARLTGWLAGDVVRSGYASPQMRGERLP